MVRENENRFLQAMLRADAPASLVVFFVALPLCMGVAIASGMPPAAGLVTGIVGGIVVGLIAGSPLQVSGPAAGLTVLVYDAVQNFGPSMLGVIVLGAGVVQFIAGLGRMGQWFRAVSPAVVEGMLAGIGVLIIGSQVHVMVDAKPGSHGLANLRAIPETLGLAFNGGSAANAWAFAFGVSTLLFLFVWQATLAKRIRQVPAPLAALALATIAAALFQAPLQRVNLPNDLLGSLQRPGAAAFARLFDPAVITAILTIAVVASAESLLCAAAVDQMHNGRRTNFDRELTAQGVGNTLCGLLGALPMTGVIVRSGANIQAGARTRLSSILHGVWLLALVGLAPSLLRLVPTACLAAILVYTGLRLVQPAAVRKLAKYGRSEAAIYIATAVAVVSTDLLKGVLIGIGLSLLRLLFRFAKLEVRLEPHRGFDAEPNASTLTASGAATFLQLPRLAAKLAEVPSGSTVHVDLRRVHVIDHACLELVESWVRQHSATGGRVVHIGPDPHQKYIAQRGGGGVAHASVEAA